MGFGAQISSIRKPPFVSALIVVSVVALGLLLFTPVYSDGLPSRSLLMGDSSAGATTTYTLGFTIPSAETLGSIKLQFCANDPLVGDTCVTPTGMDVSGVALSSQTGEIGFTILPAGTNANTIVLTRVPISASATPVSYTFNNAINPTTGGTFYARLQTFASSDASGPENDHGGLAMSINAPIQITTTVPPYLLFCGGVTITNLDCTTATGNYLNLGNFTSTNTSSGQSQILMATNAKSGYGVQVYGSTMTSGNNTINAMGVPDVSRPATSQFGLNLVANQTPQVGQNPIGPGNASPNPGYNLPNFFQFVSGSTLASVGGPDNYRELTISYIVNIPFAQPVGVYASTLTYVCLANF